jgi:hypothetical protein
MTSGVVGGDRPFEAREVELLVGDLEQVAGRARLQPRLG